MRLQLKQLPTLGADPDALEEFSLRLSRDAGHSSARSVGSLADWLILQLPLQLDTLICCDQLGGAK